MGGDESRAGGCLRRLRSQFALHVTARAVAILAAATAAGLLLLRPALWLPRQFGPLASLSKAARMPRLPGPECKLPEHGAWAVVPSPVGGPPFNMAVMYMRDEIPSHTDMSDAMRRVGHYETLGPQHTGFRKLGTLVDIGANIGDWTFLWAASGWRVLAVDPMPMNVALMNATLCANPDFQVRIVHAVLGTPEAEGSVCHICGLSNAYVKDCSSPRDARVCGAGETESIVESKTLASVIEDSLMANVDALKVDVEGFECNVLAGFPNIAARHTINFAIFEVTDKASKRCVEDFERRNRFTSKKPWGAEASLFRGSMG